MLIAALLALLAACEAPAPPTDAGPAASATVHREGCTSCHAGDAGGVHASLACTACHGGDGGAREASLAHQGLEAEPGALDRVQTSCGACHPDEVARVKTSLMSTASGLISVDRWAMGEIPSPTGHETMAELLALQDPSPAQDHLRRLCAGCHLGARRDNRDDAIQGVGSGCAACHSEPGAGPHPTLVSAPSDTSCLGCHSRSGRISLAWMGLYERGADGACADPQTLYDGRPACRAEPDVHAAAGLSCVDCHLHTELMGDGHAYAHAEEQVELRCESCHGPDPLQETWAEVSDPVSLTLLRLRGQSRDPGEAVRVGVRGTPLWNLRPDGEGWRLEARRGGESWSVPAASAGPEHAGHARLSCETCHSRWAPTCTNCHTRLNPEGEQWDFGRAAQAPGAWEEHAGAMGARPPALAVDAQGEIVPAIPGMIATLETGAGPAREVRLYAPTSPHTTTRAGRSCSSCHLDSSALGLGSGSLALGPEGARFRASADDGWTTLWPASPALGTRPGFRSLNAEEQRRVLRVGVCLPCHTSAQDPIYGDLGGATARVLANRGACALPRGAWAWLREGGG